MSEKEYHLGLDIGTNSIGYAVMDCNYHLMRAKGKTLIGTSLFREGNTAAERRGYRTTRRRLKRRKRRLKLLEAFFDPYIFEVNAFGAPYFFQMKRMLIFIESIQQFIICERL